MSAADLVFDDGDRVLAMGRLVRDGNEWWLDSQRVRTLAARAAGGRSTMSTRLVSGDAHIKAFQALEARAAKAWVHVIGQWRRNAIIVEAIGAGPGRADLQIAPFDSAELHPDSLDSIAATFAARASEWGFEVWATDAIDETGLPYAYAALFRVSYELAELVDRQPAGLVRLDPSVRRHTY